MFLIKLKNNKGFTLIELLVVIAIIGLLSTIVLASLNTARVKARDAKRKSDLQQIGKAIELLYDETGSYPPEGCNPDASSTGLVCTDPPSGDSWRTTGGMAQTFSGHNITEFIDPLPVDPINNEIYYYQYEPHCQVGSTKQGYYIRAKMESDGSWFYVRAGQQGSSPCLGCTSCW
ncbi:type II secretion system GspH family protein [Patescibacteria group bacterium]|nr:type II secretion system GspH family protein [Patescibacteria group bacterium]